VVGVIDVVMQAGRGCEMRKNILAEGVGWLHDNKKMKMKGL